MSTADMTMRDRARHIRSSSRARRTSTKSRALSFWSRSSGTFRQWFRGIRLATARMQTTRPYLLIDDDDLCRSHGGCTRDALLSRASSAGWLLSPPRSRIDRYYFRPVHGTRWIHNALPRARRNAPIIIMRARFASAAYVRAFAAREMRISGTVNRLSSYRVVDDRRWYLSM